MSGEWKILEDQDGHNKRADEVQQFVCAIEKAGRIPINSELKEIKDMLNPNSDRKWFGQVSRKINSISKQQREAWQSVTSKVNCQSQVEES